MFTVTTLDGWVRTVSSIHPHSETIHINEAAFFSSFIIIAVWGLLPMVVAILLDNFSNIIRAEAQADNLAALTFRPSTSRFLDPILKTLMDFADSEELSSRIRMIFKVLDEDGTGMISYEQFSDGIRYLIKGQVIYCSKEDYEIMTEDQSLCIGDKLDEEGFEAMILIQFETFLQRQMAIAIAKLPEDSEIQPLICSVKMLMLKKDCFNVNASSRNSVRSLRHSIRGHSKMNAKADVRRSPATPSITAGISPSCQPIAPKADSHDKPDWQNQPHSGSSENHSLNSTVQQDEQESQLSMLRLVLEAQRQVLRNVDSMDGRISRLEKMAGSLDSSLKTLSASASASTSVSQAQSHELQESDGRQATQPRQEPGDTREVANGSSEQKSDSKTKRRNSRQSVTVAPAKAVLSDGR